MIVNTNVFNFRFTLGTLIVAILVLAAYGFSSYSALKSDSDFLTHEKKLLQQELIEFIDRYDDLSLENNSLKSQFESTRQKAKIAYDSLSMLKANVSILTRFKAELMFLKRQNTFLRSDSLTTVIDNLVEENRDITTALEQQEQFNVVLKQENDRLFEALEEGAMLAVNSLKAKVFRKKSSGEIVETSKANNAESFEVCFVVAKNTMISEGTKELIIQILGPDDNVVNDRGAIEFGKYSLIYSSTVKIEYENSAEDICAVIPNNESFKKGVYHVSVFENERKLGNTQIELN